MGRKGKEKSAKKKEVRSRIVGGVGKLRLRDEDEDALIDLIAMLECEGGNGKSHPPAVIKEVSNDAGSIDGEGSDDSDDEEEEKARLSREKFIRRLIRDERVRSRADVFVRAEEKGIQKRLLHKGSSALGGPQNFPQTLSNGNKFAYSNNSIMEGTVRIEVRCEGKSGVSKLIVLDRGLDMEEALQLMRNKFGVGKKFNSLVLLRGSDTKEDLNDLRTSHLLNDSSVLLTTKKQSVIEAESLPLVAPATVEVASAPDCQVDTEGSSDSDESDDESEDDEVNHIPKQWTLPASIYQSNVGNYLPSPRRVDPEECARMRETYLTSLSMNDQVKEVLSSRCTLAIFALKETLLHKIAEHRIVVVSGETGCGKTTQLPAYLLEDMVLRGRGSEAYIICTQPRRLAATSVAEWVAFERGESVGEMIGYQIRLNSRQGPNTRLVYCTTGVLLRRLQEENFLAGVSHILIGKVSVAKLL